MARSPRLYSKVVLFFLFTFHWVPLPIPRNKPKIWALFRAWLLCDLGSDRTDCWNIHLSTTVERIRGLCLVRNDPWKRTQHDSEHPSEDCDCCYFVTLGRIWRLDHYRSYRLLKHPTFNYFGTCWCPWFGAKRGLERSRPDFTTFLGRLRRNNLTTSRQQLSNNIFFSKLAHTFIVTKYFYWTDCLRCWNNDIVNHKQHYYDWLVPPTFCYIEGDWSNAVMYTTINNFISIRKHHGMKNR